MQDSEIAKNQDYSDLYALLQATGLFNTLSNLQSPATLFAPTNQGIAEYLAAANTTLAEALADPSDATDVLLYHVVPQAILVWNYHLCICAVPELVAILFEIHKMASELMMLPTSFVMSTAPPLPDTLARGPHDGLHLTLSHCDDSVPKHANVCRPQATLLMALSWPLS